jgi:hypothetical protein
VKHSALRSERFLAGSLRRGFGRGIVGVESTLYAHKHPAHHVATSSLERNPPGALALNLVRERQRGEDEGLRGDGPSRWGQVGHLGVDLACKPLELFRGSRADDPIRLASDAEFDGTPIHGVARTLHRERVRL